jgi:hypothetical protein
MLLALVEDRESRIWSRWKGVVQVCMHLDDFAWFMDLIESLGDAPTIKNLKIAIGFPKMDFHRRRGRDYYGAPCIVNPFAVLCT